MIYDESYNSEFSKTSKNGALGKIRFENRGMETVTIIGNNAQDNSNSEDSPRNPGVDPGVTNENEESIKHLEENSEVVEDSENNECLTPAICVEILATHMVINTTQMNMLLKKKRIIRKWFLQWIGLPWLKCNKC